MYETLDRIYLTFQIKTSVNKNLSELFTDGPNGYEY
jgi:hypothetical protein